VDERASERFVMWRRQRRYSALFGVCSFSMVLERSVVLMRRWCMNMLCNLLSSSFFSRVVEFVFGVGALNVGVERGRWLCRLRE
jgi:hypothetical protein